MTHLTRRLLAVSAVLSAAGCLAACVTPGAPVVASGPAVTVGGAPTPTSAAGRVAPAGTDEQAPSFDRSAHSTSTPSSVWVIVNKTHPLPASFRPELRIVRGYQVAPPAAGPLSRLLRDAEDDGVPFKIASAFRSYGYQRGVYRAQVAGHGRAAADRVSARPGHSEHQTGLAVDLVTPDDPGCALKACFGRSPGGRWVAEHAWRYGFVVRYTAATEDVTGYRAEPWHLRYVGAPLARELHRTPRTLEEFFDVPGGDYPG